MATGCHGPITAHVFSITAFPHSHYTEKCFENVSDAYTLRTYSPGLQVQEMSLVLEKTYGKWWEWERESQLSRGRRPLYVSSGPLYQSDHMPENGIETVRVMDG